MDKPLFRVTKTNVKNPYWWPKKQVKYGNLSTAVQIYAYNKDRCDVKVELVEVTTVGEIDMEAYSKRTIPKITDFVK